MPPAAAAATPPDPFARLNAQQRRAATWGTVRTGPDARTPDGVDAGPLLVIAGAGTGKTATLAHRVAFLLMSGVPPERILLLTFSRRAAHEMTQRAGRIAAQLLGGVTPRLHWAGTFHAVGAAVLRAEAARVGLPPSFGILDRGDAADLLDWLRTQHGLAAKARRFPRKDTCLAICSHCVNTGLPLAQVLRQQFPWCAEWHDELTALFRAYTERKLADALLDFDDLLLWWAAAMDDPAFAADLSARFDHVLVDEYQDTNALQARILMALKPTGRGLAVVGDDAQSIYSFRSADVGNILQFPSRFTPPADVVVLERNYRSVQPVLDTANALMAEADAQFRKQLTAARDGGARARLVTVLDDTAQVRFVVEHVLAQREQGVALRDQAVLFRTGHHSDALEVELVRRNIPFVKYGGLKFLDAAHVKDVLSVLRWIASARHALAGFRTLQLLPGIGPVTARQMLDAVSVPGHDPAVLAGIRVPEAARAGWDGLRVLLAGLADPATPWPGQIDRVLHWYRPLMQARFDDAEVRDADLQMLARVSPQFGDRDAFLTELALDPPAATGDLAGAPMHDEDYLVLSTVHSAKGQEWTSVCVLNVADGNFPNEFHCDTAEGLAEERRLLYVAITRARDTLCLVEPLRYAVTQQARLGSRHVHGARSRFLTRDVLRTLARASDALGAGGLAALAGAGQPDGASGPAGASGQAAQPVDVAARLRSMWNT